MAFSSLSRLLNSANEAFEVLLDVYESKIEVQDGVAALCEALEEVAPSEENRGSATLGPARALPSIRAANIFVRLLFCVG